MPRCATQPNLYYTQIRRADLGSARQPLMPGDHSKLEPLLPIPNRTVKRLRADDSADYPCESRSSPGSYTQNPQPYTLGVLLWRRGLNARRRWRKRLPIQLEIQQKCPRHIGVGIFIAHFARARLTVPLAQNTVPRACISTVKNSREPAKYRRNASIASISLHYRSISGDPNRSTNWYDDALLAACLLN